MREAVRWACAVACVGLFILAMMVSGREEASAGGTSQFASHPDLQILQALGTGGEVIAGPGLINRDASEELPPQDREFWKNLNDDDTNVVLTVLNAGDAWIRVENNLGSVQHTVKPAQTHALDLDIPQTDLIRWDNVGGGGIGRAKFFWVIRRAP